jgi:8-oxo-dGTP pyrophosphatase MutT (NUDIX family)
LDLVAVEPPGAPAYEHHVVEVPYDPVGVVVHHTELGVLLLYRHRFITDTSGFEVPAGGAESGEDALDAARREVLEETGWKLGDARLMLSANVSDGLTSQRFHFVYGRADRQVADPTDAHEATALFWVPVEELAGLISTGMVPGSPSMLALLYAERFGYFDALAA